MSLHTELFGQSLRSGFCTPLPGSLSSCGEPSLLLQLESEFQSHQTTLCGRENRCCWFSFCLPVSVLTVLLLGKAVALLKTGSGSVATNLFLHSRACAGATCIKVQGFRHLLSGHCRLRGSDDQLGVSDGICRHCNLLATMENCGEAGEMSQMTPEL